MIKEHNLTIDELKTSCDIMVKELFSLKMQSSLGQLKSSSKIKDLKRAIARAKTIMHLKKIEGGSIEQ
jgi:large subunit ribosomal protein L29